MRVLSLTGDKVETHDVSEVEALSKQDDLLVWVDVPECGDEAVRLLTDVLKFHPSPSATACNEIGCQGYGSTRISSC